jgi:hypothetical protein
MLVMWVELVHVSHVTCHMLLCRCVGVLCLREAFLMRPPSLTSLLRTHAKTGTWIFKYLPF